MAVVPQAEMTQRRRRIRVPQTKVLMAAGGLVLFALVSIGLFGGPATDSADAFQIDPTDLPCDLPPFSAGGDSTPTCDLVPLPIESEQCDAPDDIGPGYPWLIRDATAAPRCYNIALIQTSDCATTTLEVVGVLHNAPSGTFDGSLGVNTLGTSLDQVGTTLPGPGGDPVALFYGVLADIPNDDLSPSGYVTTNLLQNFAADWFVSPPASCVDLTLRSDCSGIVGRASADFTLETEGSVQITTTLVPVAAGSDVVVGPNPADFATAGFWSYGITASNIPNGEYDVTMRAVGINADTSEPFDQSLGPVRLTNFDCVDQSFSCSGAAAGVTATLTRPLDPDTQVDLFVRHQQNSDGFGFGTFSGSAVGDTAFVGFAGDLATPGSYRWSVGEPESTIWESGTLYCIELFPSVFCRAGQVELIARPNGVNTLNALRQLREDAVVTVAVNGDQSIDGEDDYVWRFTEPASISPPDMAASPGEGEPINALDDVTVQAYFTPDVDLTIPTCLVDLSLECVDGGLVRVADLSGTPTNSDGFETVILKTDPLPIDSEDPPGTLATFSVGKRADTDGGPQSPDENGVRFRSNGERSIQINTPACQIGFEIVCGVDQIGDVGPQPNGRSIITYPDLDLAPTGTTTTPVDGTDVTVSVGEVIELSVDNGVYFVDSSGFDRVFVDDCEIEVGATAFCSRGWPFATFTIDPFGEFGVEVDNGTETYDEFFASLTYEWDAPYVGADMTPQAMTIEVFATYPDNVLVSPNNPLSVLPPRCLIDADVACAATGPNVGQAVFTTDLTDTPSGTQVLDQDNQPVVDGQVIPGGTQLTVRATNEVWFFVDDVEVTTSRQETFTAPQCTITIENETSCTAGQAFALLIISQGDYELLVVNGQVDDSDASFRSVNRSYRFTGDPMIVTLDVQTPNAIVLPANPVEIERPVCVVDVSIQCVAGAAVLLFNSTGTPETTITPAAGSAIDQGVPTTITATNGVFLRHNLSESFGSSVQVTSPVCELTAQIACQTGEGGPTGQAVLQANVPLLAPNGTVVTPVSGTVVASQGTVTVTATNGVHFTNSNAPTATLTAPACIVTATGVAVCANGVIEITVTTTGAAAAAVVVDSTVSPVTGTTTTITTLAAAESYVVSAVPADPATTVAAASEIVPLSPRCTIEIIATVACLSDEVVQITPSVAASSTGTVDVLAVNGDTNLPFTVAPGTAAAITVTSSDTLPADISIPSLIVPSSCDNTVVPLAGTLYLDYTAVCVADGQNVIVQVTTEGSAGILAMSINGDPAAPFLVTPAEPIVVSVLTFWGNDVVVIQGPALAPFCLAPTTPTPTPTPTTPPPAIIVTFQPLVPVTGSTPEPSPEPTPTTTPEPEATPEPTPTTTPEPEATPEPTPQDTAEPTPEPEPAPDQVLSTRASVRQHGQSSIELPAECDVDEIDIPGAVKFVRAGLTDDGMVRFIADTATLDVGTYKETISCAGQQIDVELFVYRQIGGARGEANSISRLAVTAGVLTLVLVGVPGILARKDEEVDEI